MLYIPCLVNLHFNSYEGNIIPFILQRKRVKLSPCWDRAALGFMAVWLPGTVILTTGVFSSPLLFHSQAPGSSRAPVPSPSISSKQPAPHRSRVSVQ